MIYRDMAAHKKRINKGEVTPYQKAGIILCGPIDGVEHFIAPYSEGRFGNDQKYYVVGKGAIDVEDGEDVFTAAIRETSEETGIDVRTLFGRNEEEIKQNLDTLKRTGKLENIETSYAGVRLKSIHQTALDYTYRGREDNTNHLAMFRIELDGIEKLKPHLKNQRNTSPRLGYAQNVQFPIRSVVCAEPEKYPTFEARLAWLRDMKMPDQPWTKGQAGKPLKPHGTAVGVEHWFAERESWYMAHIGRPGQHIDNVKDWQKFQARLTHADYETLRGIADEMKAELKTLGVVGGDTSVVKFDTKDSPLAFYQEGADILTGEQYLLACVHSAINRRDYAMAFSGNTAELRGVHYLPLTGPTMAAKDKEFTSEHNKDNRVERVTDSQFACVVWATGQQAIDKVARHFEEDPKEHRWLSGKLLDRGLIKRNYLKETLTKALKIIDSGKRQTPINQIIGIDSHARVAQASEVQTLS